MTKRVEGGGGFRHDQITQQKTIEYYYCMWRPGPSHSLCKHTFVLRLWIPKSHKTSSLILVKASSLEKRLVFLMNMNVASRISLFVIELYTLLPYNNIAVR